MSLTSYRDKLLIKLMKFSFPFTYGLETGLKFMVGFWSIVTAIIENRGLAHFLSVVLPYLFKDFQFFRTAACSDDSFATSAILFLMADEASWDSANKNIPPDMQMYDAARCATRHSLP
jgi:hypothetical protein